MNFETPVILCPQQKGFRCSQLLVLSSSSAVRSSLQSRSGGDLLSAGHAGGLAAGSCLFMMVILLLSVAVIMLRLRLQLEVVEVWQLIMPSGCWKTAAAFWVKRASNAFGPKFFSQVMQSDRAGLPRHAQAERTLPDVPLTSR